MHRPVHRPVAALLTFALLIGAFQLQAAWYNPFSWGKKKTVETLIVTSNYLDSRILAELIQYHLEQPLLLIPTEDDEMFYAIVHPGAKEAKAIPPADYLERVFQLHPQTVLVLGNADYVPESYVSELRKDGHTVVTVGRDGQGDWKQIATSVADMLKIKGLAEDFEKARSQFDSQGRRIHQRGVDEVTQDWESVPARTTDANK